MAAGMVSYGGVDGSRPVEAHGGTGATGTTATTPSLTTTVANSMLLHLVTKRQGSIPAPAGSTPLWSVLSGTGTDNVGIGAGRESFAGPGGTPSRSSATGSTLDWLAQAVALRPAVTATGAGLTWTASPSSWATGYWLERSAGGAVSARTVTPVGTASTTEGPLVNGVTYTWRLWAYHGAWVSSAVTTTLTPSC